MRKTFLILLFLSVIGVSQGQKILQQDYSFLVTDGGVDKLHQNKDTFFILKCYIDRDCQSKPANSYKILSVNKNEEFTILRLEQLDEIASLGEPYRGPRYSILALKGIDTKQLGFLFLGRGLTKKQFDTVQTDIQLLKSSFFYSYYSDAYLKELATYKKISTKSEAMEVMKEGNNLKYKPLIESYLKTNTGDTYLSGITAEILVRICIEKGYNPIGANLAIEKLIK